MGIGLSENVTCCKKMLLKGRVNSIPTYKIVMVSPTAFFYQAPIYRELHNHPRIELDVLFCSDEGALGTDVKLKFDSEQRWGNEEETLDGYNYQFVRNYSPYASYLRWPFGLMNFGIGKCIRKSKPDALIMMSWVNLTDIITIAVCLIAGIKLLFLTDANVQAEGKKPKWLIGLKRMLLGKFLFKLAGGFLYAGAANKELYLQYGVPVEKLARFAFSWESSHFLAKANDGDHDKFDARSELGIPKDHTVILYCGRLSPEKAPLHLLKAFAQMTGSSHTLMFVGDGALRRTLEEYSEVHEIENVQFLGFQNRKDIFKYYVASDVLVVPSIHEATGAVVTEAMCFGLPVIISDQVGFGKDLVRHDENGYIFKVGDIQDLTRYLQGFVDAPETKRVEMGELSSIIIKDWSDFNLGESLVSFLDTMSTSPTRTP